MTDAPHSIVDQSYLLESLWFCENWNGNPSAVQAKPTKHEPPLLRSPIIGMPSSAQITGKAFPHENE